MTSYTQIAEGERPTISVNPSHTISRIEDNTYGGFTEHMGRCIYGGIYDPGNPLSDENGFRKDVIEAMRELDVPVVRYPGGNFVATYHWLDGVGPRDQRPRRRELAWVGEESNQFGTDEFLKWCEIVGTEPYLCLNFGTGTLDEALGWVEYCNATSDTQYANLRRKHGREAPYKVKYWALGNEMYGPWQVCQMTKEDYAKRAYQWAKALKLLDPDLVLILCGETGFSTWDSYVVKECIRQDPHGLGPPPPDGVPRRSLIDMHSIHIYTASSNHLENVIAPRSAERAIEIAAGLIDLARIENKVPPSVPRQKICFDEWNVWDPVRAPGELGGEERYTLSDALAVAAWLNVFVRQAKHIGMANIAQSVNVISPLMTHATGLTKQTTWWPLLLFSRHMRGSSLAVHLRCGAYEGPTKPAWIRGTVDTPWLDVSAALGEDGVVSLAVVNIHPERDVEVELQGLFVGGGGGGGGVSGGGDGGQKKKKKVDAYTVTAETVEATNMDESENVGIRESTWEVEEGTAVVVYTFLKHSFTMLRWAAV